MLSRIFRFYLLSIKVWADDIKLLLPALTDKGINYIKLLIFCMKMSDIYFTESSTEQNLTMKKE